MGVSGQSLPPAVLHPEKTRYPLYRRLGRPQGRSGRVRKILPTPEFDPQTVQPVAQSLHRLPYPGPSRVIYTQKRKNISVEFNYLRVTVGS